MLYLQLTVKEFSLLKKYKFNKLNKLILIYTSNSIKDKGDVFGWGNSEYAQFSSATNEMQLNVPRRLRFANFQKKIVDVACGGTMCGVLDGTKTTCFFLLEKILNNNFKMAENGLVYVWGYGILGKGPAVDHLSSPSLLAPELFGANEIDSNVRVKTIKAGLSQFAAITSKCFEYYYFF